MQVNYSSSSITVIFDDGTIFTANCPKEVAVQIINLENPTPEEIVCLLYPKSEEIKREVDLIVETNNKIKVEHPDFYWEENELFRVGIPVAIPRVLAEQIKSCIDSESTEELAKLDKFWAWTSLIRTAESRESFYNYVKANKMLITKQGFVVAFRRANRLNPDSELNQFVKENYERLRKNKKSTNVNVFKDSFGKLSFTNDVGSFWEGNLKELYTNMNSNVGYESVHSGKNGKMKYYLGEESRLPIEECDFSDAECSEGLHVHSGCYHDYAYGDVRLAVVFNPMDTVRSPYRDSSKLRVQALKPLCEIKEINDFELTPEIEDMIEQLYQDHQQNLQSLIADESNFAVGGVKHTLLKEVPDINLKQMFSNISKVMVPDVSNRVIKI